MLDRWALVRHVADQRTAAYCGDLTGLFDHFRIDRGKAARFLLAVEAGYLPNPYHCATHAADVLQTLHVIL